MWRAFDDLPKTENSASRSHASRPLSFKAQLLLKDDVSRRVKIELETELRQGRVGAEMFLEKFTFSESVCCWSSVGASEEANYLRFLST